MRDYIKRMSILIIIIFVTFLGFKFDLIRFGSGISFSSQEEKSSAIITEKIEMLCNLSTVRYNYQEILDYSDIVKFGKMELPFGLGEKKVLITYRAYINGGCQFISLEEVSEEHIRVYLGKGRVLDNVLQLDSINIYDMQEGIFNKFNINDDTVLINEDMKKYEEENREEITGKAEENADEMIKNFLQTLGYKNIEIIFQ